MSLDPRDSGYTTSWKEQLRLKELEEEKRKKRKEEEEKNEKPILSGIYTLGEKKVDFFVYEGAPGQVLVQLKTDSSSEGPQGLKPAMGFVKGEGRMYKMTSNEYETLKNNILNTNNKWQVEGKDGSIVTIPGTWSSSKKGGKRRRTMRKKKHTRKH